MVAQGRGQSRWRRSVNHLSAHVETAAWRRIVDDTTSPTVARQSVRALVAAAEWWRDECERLEAVSRLDCVHLAQLAKVNRDLREMLPGHMLADPARAIERAS